MPAEVKWLDDIPGGYHDSRCTCDGHCRNCFDDLDQTRRVRQQLIDDRKVPASSRLGSREKYCSPYCRNRAKRERALDRHLNRNAVPQGEQNSALAANN
jgi:hypothetical protein